LRHRAEVEGELLVLAPAHEDALEQRREDLVALWGDGDADAEVLADALVLAEQDVEDDAVDAVVLPVDHEGPDDVARLAEAVDAAFALLVPGGVPRQVVVDDRLEVLLEVDALGEAVGGDEHLG